MENIDTQGLTDVSDEELLMAHVVCCDAELLCLDAFLAKIFSQRRHD